ncbi:lipoyl(octanoyl) transferase LipB [uncultured Pseudokineococcus sp.]|uniref:lipoyl(octanoyl) transferase LipB n=1 Tax=uncultured Pseudokineococcus sp. TaxID=1642928 RepID=UPI0026202EBF|nr:lipoyl(octanoyl) transferase LipB [uncultured Pseudokineococcus sp.]
MRFEHVGFGSDAVEYRRGWELQRAAHVEVVAGAEDVVLLLEHEAVYTAGKRTLDSERPFDGTPVVDVDRGGKITWHGPGQLVGYPITRLPDPVDVVAYVRRLEQVLIDACADLGLATERVEGRSGVWVRGDGSGLPGRRDRKVGAIGIRVAQGVTMHGFALNCDNVLDGFGGIVPCGIPDADVTTLSGELGRPLAVADALPVVERHLARTLPVPPRERAERPQPAAAGV